MSKKKDIENEMNEQDKLDPAATSSQETESTSSTSEADALITEQEDAVVQAETAESEADGEMSSDDLLDDVRRSIIIDSTEKEEAEQSKWWTRIGKKPRKKKAEPQPVEIIDEPIELPVTKAEIQDNEQDEYVEQLDELIDMLEDNAGADVVDEETPVTYEGEAPVKEQVQEPVDVEELKKRAFSTRAIPEEEERNLSEVRSVALDEGEEVFVEVEAKAEDPMKDRMKAIENALMPYRRYLNFVFIFVSLVMVFIVSVSLYRLYQRSLPPPPVEDVAPLLPYPVGMNLPGGLNFTLGKGKLVEGRWDPRGPEWLEGTEICRWIAIPYSRQLEAVVRTLTREDQIELIMSNNDVLEYTVSSIDQLSIEDMQTLDAGTPCMLLVLAQAGTEERWVVTAIP